MLSGRPLVGRESETSAIEALLAEERVLTIVGLGGVGKTRLALHIAERVRARMEDLWVAVVDLVDVATEDQLLERLHRSLRMQARQQGVGEKHEALCQGLRHRGRGLLVLDNVEQIVRECSHLTAAIIDANPHLRVLITSRIALDVNFERVYPLAPLSIANGVTLFEDRAARAGVARVWSNEERVLLETLVRRLDGLPLAIELAAARTTVMSPRDLLDRIDQRFDLLRAAVPNLKHDRHHTLESVLEGSFSLLPDEARRLLNRCAVFRGSFDLAAAGAVIDSVSGLSTEESMEQLVRHSLLVREASASAPTRFRLLASVREYAAKSLTRHQEEAARSRHAAFFVEFATRALESLDDALVATLDAIEREQEHLEDAFEWLLRKRSQESAPVALALAQWMMVRDSGANAVALLSRCQAALHQKLSRREAADLALAMASAMIRSGSYSVAIESLSSLLKRDRRLDAGRRGRATFLLARSELILSRERASRRSGERAARLARAVKDARMLANALCHLGDAKDEVELIEEGVRVAERVPIDPVSRGFAHWSLGRQYRKLNRLVEATFHLERALDLYREVGDRYGELIVLQSLARVHQLASHKGEALALFRATLATFSNEGNVFMACITRYALGAALHSVGLDEDGRRELGHCLRDARMIGATETETAVIAHLAILTGPSNLSQAELLLARAPAPAEPASQALIALAEVVLGALRALPSNPISAIERIEREFRPFRSIAEVDAAAQTAVRVLMNATQVTQVPTYGLEIADDGSWFRHDGGPRVTLPRGGALSRIVLHLAQAARERPSAVCSRDELISIGWPGERILTKAADLRLRNAISRLRNEGMRDALVTQTGGYLLDPRRAVLIVSQV